MSVRERARRVLTDPPRLIERHQLQLRQIRRAIRCTTSEMSPSFVRPIPWIANHRSTRFPNFAHRSWPLTMPEWVGVH